MSVSISIPTHLSFSKTLSTPTPLFLSKPSHLTLQPRKMTIIRMGGGPRTYPGGVSKWQWKRMQAKKSKQLLKARLSRERQIYEMRKRAELKAAISDLERPWEVVEKAPTLFSVSADEQVKVLADRFQKPGGFDLWSDRDGPQLFQTPDGLPSARFFPKGVVHSVKPYGKIAGFSELDSDNNNGDLDSDSDFDSGFELEKENKCENRNGYRRNSEHANKSERRNGYRRNSEHGNKSESGNGNRNRRNGVYVNGKLKGENRNGYGRMSEDIEDSLDLKSGHLNNSDGESSMDRRNVKRNGGKLRKNGDRRRVGRGLGELDSGQVGFETKQRGVSALMPRGDDRINNRSRSDSTIRRRGVLRNSESEVYDMSLQQDGTYGFQAENRQSYSNSQVQEGFDFESF